MDKYNRLNELMKCEDLESMMEHVYALLGNPAFVIDMGHNVLAYTRVLVENKRWKEIVVDAKLTKDFMEGNVRLKAEHAKALLSEKAILFENTYHGESQIKKFLISENEKVGMLMVLSYHKPFEEEDLVMVDLIGNLIAYKMVSHQGMMKWYGMKQSTFFLSILGGRDYSEEQLRHHLEFLLIKPQKYWYICVLRGGREDIYSDAKLDLMEFNELRNCFAFIYGEEILIIINCMSQIRDMEEELFDLYSLLKQKKLSMGVSNGFCDISLLRQYYQQALAALNFGMKLENNQNIFFWQNFCIYDMFERVNLDILNGYIHPDIMTLHGYDVKNGTDLCHTLLVYLNCNRSQAKTAQILYIHRNTVNYRIHQCREIMGSDLKADTDLFSYTLSLMILAYHFTK